jgi:hypothetical protein
LKSAAATIYPGAGLFERPLQKPQHVIVQPDSPAVVVDRCHAEVVVAIGELYEMPMTYPGDDCDTRRACANARCRTWMTAAVSSNPGDAEK